MATALPVQPPTSVGPVEWVLGLLDAVGSQPLGARRRQCPNPGHGGDTDPSLSITARETGGVKLYCFAGCPETDILAALGLGLRQLYQPPGISPARFAAAARLRLAFPPLADRRYRHPASRGYRLEPVHFYGPADGTRDRITGHRLLRWRLPSTGAKELEWETTLRSGRTVPGLMGVPLRALPLYHETDVRAATVLHLMPGHGKQRILVTESESSVDFLHAQKLKLWSARAPAGLTNWCATTWAGGAHAVDTRRMAAILGAHPYTVLMPDFDQAGLVCLRAMLDAGLGPAVLLGAPGEDARELCRRLGPERFARAVNHALAAARLHHPGRGRLAVEQLVVTVANDRLVDIPVAELDRLLTGSPATAAAAMPSTTLPRLATPTSPAFGHDRTGASEQATPASPSGAAATRHTDRPTPRAQPTANAASRPGQLPRQDGTGQRLTPPPSAAPPVGPRPRSLR